MIKYLLKQVRHQWRHQGWRITLELIIITGILVLFISNKFGALFLQWQAEYSVSSWRITLFLSLILTGMFYFSSIFLFAYMLPRQKALTVFVTKPLSLVKTIQILCYHVLKYQILYIILLLPISIAIVSALGWMYMISANVFFLSASLTMVLFQCLLLIKLNNQFRFISVSLIAGLLLIASWIFFFWYLNSGLSVVLFIYIILYISVYILYKKNEFSHIEDLLFVHRREYTQKSKPTVKRKLIIVQIASVLQAMFWKEWYAMWRNPRYRRLKLLALFVFILGLTVFSLSTMEHAEIWALLFSIIVIWFHYSSVFNEKYVQPDPEMYFKLRPVRFYQLWLSKFLAEGLYAFLLILLFQLYLLITQVSIIDQIHLFGICLLFTVFVLGSMVTFRLMFYEDPRMAGYAYHFMLLFVVIMSVNFRLVGPLVSLGLMIFYLYKSYRYFKM